MRGLTPVSYFRPMAGSSTSMRIERSGKLPRPVPVKLGMEGCAVVPAECRPDHPGLVCGKGFETVVHGGASFCLEAWQGG